MEEDDMFVWDDEIGELICECGRLVSDMELKFEGSADVEFEEFDRVKDDTVVYIPTFGAYDKQELVCKCGRRWKVELWEEEEPFLQFTKQADGSFIPS